MSFVDKRDVVTGAPVWVAALVGALMLAGCHDDEKDRPGAAVAHDEAAQTRPSDRSIMQAVDRALIGDPAVAAHRVDVEVNQGVVTLSGMVESLRARDRATEVAEAIKGVRAVVDELEVKPRLRPDEEIRRDVLQALMVNPTTESYEIGVTASGAKVTLSGEVESWAEKELAASVAKGVRGVAALDNQIKVTYPARRSDQEIASDVEGMLRHDVRVDHGLIDVAVKRAVVTLSGIVGSAAERTRAIIDAWVVGVNEVRAQDLKVRWSLRDQIRARQPAVTDEETIERAINTALFYDPRVDSADIHVELIDGAATLTGEVRSLAAKRAAGETTRNTTGVASVSNVLEVRKSAEDDAGLARELRRALGWDPVLERYGLQVKVVGRIAQLSGTVPTQYDRQLADRVAAQVAGIQAVANTIRVNPPEEPVSDQELAARVRERLEWSPQVHADRVTVRAEDHVVTLTGQVESYLALYTAAERARDAGAWRVNNQLAVRRR